MQQSHDDLLDEISALKEELGDLEMQKIRSQSRVDN